MLESRDITLAVRMRHDVMWMLWTLSMGPHRVSRHRLQPGWSPAITAGAGPGTSPCSALSPGSDTGQVTSLPCGLSGATYDWGLSPTPHGHARVQCAKAKDMVMSTVALPVMERTRLPSGNGET